MPKVQVPSEVAAFLEKYPWLKLRRKRNADPQPLFVFRCTRCNEDLWTEEVSKETAEFRFWQNGFTQGKPSINDMEKVVRCWCESEHEPNTYEIEYESY